MSRFAVWLAGFALVAATAGCVTAYQPLGSTGGYAEKQLAKDTFHVSFFGNGSTLRIAVLKYFLFRCAELTIAQGYEYFEIYSVQRDSPRGALERNHAAMAGGSPFLKVRGTYTPPTIVYVPGGAVARWQVTGIIRMYPKDILGTSAELFSAREVTALLESEVRSGNPGSRMPAALKRADGKFPVAPIDPGAAVPPPSPSTEGPVRMDDLKNLLPK